MKRFVYIPIEIKSREFIAKLILSLKLASKGFGVIVGKSTEVEKLCRFGPKGVYLGTSIMKQHNDLFCKLKKSGSIVIAADEEGLVYYNESDFIKNKIYSESLNNIESFIAWGNHHKQLIEKKVPNVKLKVKSIGNIRFELLKPKYAFLYNNLSDSINKKYKNYILINTNFGAYNNFLDSDNYLNVAKNLAGESEQDLLFRKEKIKHQEYVFNAFVDLAKELSFVFPQFNVIIRPHPSENMDRWKTATKNTNVMIIRDGDVIPWIMGAECVIQQNCTTAIESLCLGKKIFSYLPKEDKRFDDGLPNKIAPIFNDQKELIATIRSVIFAPETYSNILEKNKRIELDDYVSGMCIETDIYEDYIKIFEEMDFKTTDKFNMLFLKQKYNIYKLISLLLNRELRKNTEYINQKYPHTSFDEWEDLIRKLDDAHGTNFLKIKKHRLSKDAYYLTL